MPDPNDPKPDESINTMFQLVVRVATDAASSIATTSTTLANFEGRVAAMEDTLSKLVTAAETAATIAREKKEEDREKRVEQKERWDVWRSFFVNLFTPQFIIQIITIVGVGLGLWTQIPGSSIPFLTDTHESTPAPDPQDPGTIEP